MRFKELQCSRLHSPFDELQKRYGEPGLCAIYGAGCNREARAMFVFMNPTARNIAAKPVYAGLRAPWIGTKQIWKLFFGCGLIKYETYKAIAARHVNEWTEAEATSLYEEIKLNGAYITNLAKCTQKDARPLSDVIFRCYLELFEKEVQTVEPERIITFGNQVSSIILQKPVKVSGYYGVKAEMRLIHGKNYPVYPVFYPVGQGMRNMNKAILRIKEVLNL